MIVVSYLLAVLTAVLNALGNVLMSKAARSEPRERQFHLQLVLDMVRNRTWLAGIGVSLLTWVTGTAAIGTGAITVVQPIVAIELPMTLIGASWAYGLPLGRRDWQGILVMSAGLAGMVFFLDPQAGRPSGIPSGVWVLGSSGTVLPIAALYVLGHRTDSPVARSAYLGAASGLSYGLAAAYTKGMTNLYITDGIVGVLTGWQLYVSVAVSTFAMWLLINAYAAGRIAASQPGITLLDPTIAMLWGVFVFHEQVRGGTYTVLAVAFGAAMAAGAVMLARAPQLRRVR